MNLKNKNNPPVSLRSTPPAREARKVSKKIAARCGHRALRICFLIKPFVGCDVGIAPWNFC